MTDITDIFAREILDSRGTPTIEVDVSLANGACGRACIPANDASTAGPHEAVELRDKDMRRYGGRGVLKAINNIRDIIAPEVCGMEAGAQEIIDHMMCRLDDTENKAMLGANAILSVSLAVARARANDLEIPLYRYLGGVQANSLPVPLCTLLSSGGTASQSVSIAPVGMKSFSDALRASSEVFHALEKILEGKGIAVNIAGDGGFSVQTQDPSEALVYAVGAILAAEYIPGKDFFLSVDVGAGRLYDSETQKYKFGAGMELTSEELAAAYDRVIAAFPIFAIEDPFAPADRGAWSGFTASHGDLHILGGAIFGSNAKLLAEAQHDHIANGVIIRPNQIGTLTETFDAVRMAQRGHYMPVMGHMSGETEDTFIADLSVATSCRMIKAGGLFRSEHIAKYNQLLRIEEELGDDAYYIGTAALRHGEA